MEPDTDLSDAELRTELKRFGFNCGPIVASTRSIYLKKLMKLRTTEQNNTQSIESIEKTRNLRVSQRSAKKKTVDNAKKPEITETVHNVGVDRNCSEYIAAATTSTPQISTPKSQTFTDASGRYGPSIPATNSAASRIPPLLAPVTGTNRFAGTHNSSSLTGNAIARNTTPQRGAGHTPTRKTYMYYRDVDSDLNDNSVSETDDDDGGDSFKRPGPLAGALSRVSGWLNSRSPGGRPSLNVAAGRVSFASGNIQAAGRTSTGGVGYDEDARLQVSDTDLSDVDVVGRRSFLFGKTSRNDPSQQLHDAGVSTTSSLLLLTPSEMAKNLASPRPLTGLSHQALSGISDDDYAGNYGDHQPTLKRRSRRMTVTNNRESLSAGTYYSSGPLYRWMSRVSPHVPNLILISGVVLFMALTLSYIVLKDHHGEVGKMADLERLICPSTSGLSRCLEQNQVTRALPLLSTTFDILSRYSGEYYCGDGRQSSPRLPVITVSRLVHNQLAYSAPLSSDGNQFQAVWNDALFLLLHVGKAHFGLIALDALGRELANSSNIPDIHELQSLQPYFSGTCRISRWLAWLFDVLVTALWFLVAAILLLGVLWSLHWLRNRKLQQAEERAARIRELVGEIVRALQNQLRENETNPDQPPYLPVSFLRDRLRQTHSDALQLWPDITRYVYEIETCILVQEWRGVGETWQWQGGTGWQGSALLDKSQKAPFAVPPTECLKIRNMFCTESLDERAKRRIKRELLKKLIPCGSIYHIGLDSVGTKGLVYVKCADQDTAGRVYHSIHANYFDGRLLTVKFLRNTKYCLRFPEAHNTCQPLTLGFFE